jgi:hypothetical protein
MSFFDGLPDEILVMIFSYLSTDDLALSIRNVCLRWRRVSEYKELWYDSSYSPEEDDSLADISLVLENVPALRYFYYFGTCNVIEKLSEKCKELVILHIPHIALNANHLQLVMESLKYLIALCILISPTEEGVKMTRIIGQCETLAYLSLTSSDTDTTMPGLLTPIADGCPNLNTLECEATNCPTDEICYFLQRKKQQFVMYEHCGAVTANFFAAINACTNLYRLSLTAIKICSLPEEIPHMSNLQNLKCLHISDCSFPEVKIIPLTIFADILPRLLYFRITNSIGNITSVTNKILLRCPLLINLDLQGNELRFRGLRNIGFCKHLKYLDISRCITVGKKGMKYIAKCCPELLYLDVSNIPISDPMFQQILRCRNLQNLFMINCDLSGINLLSISARIGGLHFLHIGPHFQLPDDVRSELKKKMPQLLIREY